MADLQQDGVRNLLEGANHAVVSTLNHDGSIHSAVAWVSLEDGEVAVNSAEGRHWPTNLERDPHVNVLVRQTDNPVRVRRDPRHRHRHPR